MKTTISVQKTENRNKKTSVMKTLAVVTAVTLFSLTANASANSSNQMENEGGKHFYAHASLALMSTVMEPRHVAEATIEISAESSLEVEPWMVNESMFTSPVAIEETEESLEVESWMLSPEVFVDTLQAQESEKPLEVEAWMLDQNRWIN